MREREAFLRIGVITQPHGIRGEVKVYPTTDDPDRFLQVEDVLVERKGVREPMKIEGTKYFKQMVILKLSGISDMTQAETYRQADILIHRSQSAPLEPGHYFIVDLLGLEVYEDERHLGTVTDFLQTGANNVYVVTKEDGKELLIPDIPDCILHVDVDEGILKVRLLPGLEA
jgi:16S rRNA processing protein RimM